jgi:hypothetical protein
MTPFHNLKHNQFIRIYEFEFGSLQTNELYSPLPTFPQCDSSSEIFSAGRYEE